jgi:glutathione S-transferase
MSLVLYYGSGSPFAWRVQLALEHKALPYERKVLSFSAGDTRKPEFLALNPRHRVPVLVDGDFVLPESNTICRYLAAQQGRSDLLPRSPRERAAVERWMDWQATELNNAWRYAFMALVRRHPAFTDTAQIAASTAEWNRQMTLFDAQLQRSGAFAAGDRFTLADVVLGVSTQRWLATPIERPALDGVSAYHERLRTRPAYIAQGIGEHP